MSDDRFFWKSEDLEIVESPGQLTNLSHPDPIPRPPSKELTGAVLTAMAHLRGARARTPNAAKRVQKYHDAIVSRASKKAAALLSSELTELREDMDAATDYADLKRRVVRRFKARKSPAELAALLARMNLIANAGGRADVLEHL